MKLRFEKKTFIHCATLCIPITNLSVISQDSTNLVKKVNCLWKDYLKEMGNLQTEANWCQLHVSITCGYKCHPLFSNQTHFDCQRSSCSGKRELLSALRVIKTALTTVWMTFIQIFLTVSINSFSMRVFVKSVLTQTRNVPILFWIKYTKSTDLRDSVFVNGDMCAVLGFNMKTNILLRRKGLWCYEHPESQKIIYSIHA